MTVPLGAGGMLSITYAAPARATAQVVFDVTGYFLPEASAATYVVVTPNRLVDSRLGLGLASGLTANVARTFPVTGQSADPTRNIPADAIAVTGNLTVTGQTAPGYFALTPVATNSPTTSTLNFPLADSRANGVTVPLGAGGMLSVTYVAKAGATAQVVFDVTGYFVPNASGATYVTVTPNRLVDSRIGLGLGSRLSAKVARTFPVTGRSTDSTKNIPSDAIAVTGNLTVTGQTASGYFALTTVATNSPATSTLNFPLADNRANGVTVPLGAGGMLSITYAAPARATAQVVFDVTGYFLP